MENPEGLIITVIVFADSFESSIYVINNKLAEMIDKNELDPDDKIIISVSKKKKVFDGKFEAIKSLINGRN